MTSASLEQAIAALAGGRSVRIGTLTLLSIETASDSALDRLDCASLIISAGRGAALGLGNARAMVPGQPLRIERSDWLTRDLVRALADPGRDFDRIIPGPLNVTSVGDPEAAAAGLRLARLAGLIPALWEVAPDDSSLAVDVKLINAPTTVHLAARAKLPVDGVSDTQIVAFREDGTGAEHVALLIGAPGGKPPLVRLHSECLTGDVFGSLKCDCGPQLKEALRLIEESGGGILLYLRQEGRGIGLANKIRAYALQDRGLDTVDANRRLGFADDEREYGSAAAMLRALGASEVRLLTNNPAKVAGLEDAGIRVVERVAHHLPTNPHNADYIATKRDRSGHLA
ncbi:MAG: GTP cyclohydrolase II [Sphingomicrobium sp.]